MKNRTAILGIGIPCTGKTTHLQQYARRISAVYISPDDIREELFGDALMQEGQMEVWQRTYRCIQESLISQAVVIDATNARATDRRGLIGHCRTAGATSVIGLWFTAPLSVCLYRNRRRQRHVPAYAMVRMEAALRHEPPMLTEGFDQLITICTDIGLAVTIPDLL